MKVALDSDIVPNAAGEAFKVGMWARAKFFDDEHARRWCEAHGVYDELPKKECTGGVFIFSPYEPLTDQELNALRGWL